MKKIHLFLLFAVLSGWTNAQTWKSISKTGTYSVTPSDFIINPYLNQLWLFQDLRAAVIENDGTIHQFYEEETMQGLYPFDELTFAFTPEHIYYSNNSDGLYNFDNYVSNLIYSHAEISSITTNIDTVYIVNSAQNQGFYKYTEDGLIITNKDVDKIAAKHNFIYCDIGVLAQISGPNSTDWNLLYYDPQYMSGAHREFKFSRHTDSLFVCGKNGISIAYNYDFLDTIAPGNSIDMPARNVLEIEFDHLDRLWAVFGDASNKAFALAMYENGSWVNRYDASNSPIDFATYKGFEIDTLGNLWVVDNYNLHTLLTPDSPQWLSTVELDEGFSADVYPNPSEGVVNVAGSENTEGISVYDYTGRKVYECRLSPAKMHSVDLGFLYEGNYVVEVRSGQGVSRRKLVLVK